ncbi:MAG: hypothetical protein IPK21_23460, partial [Haliscomenobacter sp.]|nr:hypothetical protein [Haliscomenobacter sp.]
DCGKAVLKERENAREASIDGETAAQEATCTNPVALFRTWESLPPQHSVLIADGAT